MKNTKKRSPGLIALCAILAAVLALTTACASAPTGEGVTASGGADGSAAAGPALVPSADGVDATPVDTEDGDVFTDAAPAETEDGDVLTDAAPAETEDGDVLTEAAPAETEDGGVSDSAPAQTVSQSLGTSGSLERKDGAGEDPEEPAPTAAPGHTATPDHTAAPGHTAAPSHTATPGHTAAPTHTATPGHTAAPTHTPAHTAAPGKSSHTSASSGSSSKPSATKDSGKTWADPQPCEHEWGDWIITEESTCQNLGSKYRVCKKCGQAAQTTFVDGDAPNYHQYKHVEVKATCTKAGSEYDVCVFCGAKKNVYTLHALGHNMTQVITSPGSCRAPSYGYNKCTRCDYRTPERTLGYGQHKYEATEVIQPTCTTGGYTVYTCTVKGCGSVKHDNYTVATGHKWKEDTAATCTAAGTRICSVCGVTESVGSPNGHTWHETSRQSPNCTNEGSVTYTCSVCGTSKTETIPIDPNGHRWVLEEDRQGLKEKCSLCDATRPHNDG